MPQGNDWTNPSQVPLRSDSVVLGPDRLALTIPSRWTGNAKVAVIETSVRDKPLIWAVPEL